MKHLLMIVALLATSTASGAGYINKDWKYWDDRNDQGAYTALVISKKYNDMSFAFACDSSSEALSLSSKTINFEDKKIYTIRAQVDGKAIYSLTSYGANIDGAGISSLMIDKYSPDFTNFINQFI